MNKRIGSKDHRGRSSSTSHYERAVGLQYGGQQGETPLLTVKGEALRADEIVRIAKRFGIPVVEHPQLAETLSRVEIDRPIPERLFEAVAIVLNALERGTVSGWGRLQTLANIKKRRFDPSD